MNILFISSNPMEASNSAMISNIGLIKGFLQLGHEVTFVTFKSYEHMVQDDSNKSRIAGVRAIRIEPNKTYQKLTGNKKHNKLNVKIKRGTLNVARAVFHNFSLYDNYKSAIKNSDAISIEDDFDITISCSDPKSSHLLAHRIMKNSNRNFGKWIQYWGDPMLIDISRKSKLPSYVVKREEASILKKADFVVYVSPLTLEAQSSLYPALKDKFHYIPLPYQEVTENGHKDLTAGGSVKVGYFGGYHSSIRNILPLYNSLLNEPNIQLNIVGDSDINLTGYENVIIQNRVDYKTVQRYEMETDILVVICNNRGTQIPGKVFYYASTDKPVLIILDGESQKIKEHLNQFNRFYFCENHPESIRTTLVRIINESKNTYFKPLYEFNPVNIAKQFIEVVNN